jgi:pyrimidine operon attenuation protein/uracil phosphoribosyltransferase
MQNSKLTSEAPTKVVRNKGNDDTKTDTSRVAKTPTKIVKKTENNYVVIDKTKKVNNLIGKGPSVRGAPLHNILHREIAVRSGQRLPLGCCSR